MPDAIAPDYLSGACPARRAPPSQLHQSRFSYLHARAPRGFKRGFTVKCAVMESRDSSALDALWDWWDIGPGEDFFAFFNFFLRKVQEMDGPRLGSVLEKNISKLSVFLHSGSTNELRYWEYGRYLKTKMMDESAVRSLWVVLQYKQCYWVN